MKITADTMLYVVDNKRAEGVSHLTLEGLVNAVKGGMKLDEVTVFDGVEEADEHSRRVKLLNQGAILLERLSTHDLDKVISAIEETSTEVVIRKLEELLG